MRRQVGFEIRRSFILIVAIIFAFALLWYASLRIAAISHGGVDVVAKAVFLILTCLACIAIGFVLPMAPVINALIGSAFWAGLLATAGALAGMSLSDALLTRFTAGASGIAPMEPAEDLRSRTAHSLDATEPDATRPPGAPN
jgi:uncharacterized membrane protein YoaK (UPF0700 family)